MILPEVLYRAPTGFSYPAQFIQRRVVVIGGAVQIVTVPVYEGAQDRHLIINTCWVAWNLQANATTQTRAGEINVQLVDLANSAVLTFAGARNNPGGLRPDYAQNAWDFPGGSPENVGTWSNLVPAGCWVPAGMALQVVAIARNAVPLINSVTVALTGFAIPVSTITR